MQNRKFTRTRAGSLCCSPEWNKYTGCDHISGKYFTFFKYVQIFHLTGF